MTAILDSMRNADYRTFNDLCSIVVEFVCTNYYLLPSLILLFMSYMVLYVPNLLVGIILIGLLLSFSYLYAQKNSEIASNERHRQQMRLHYQTHKRNSQKELRAEGKFSKKIKTTLPYMDRVLLDKKPEKTIKINFKT